MIEAVAAAAACKLAAELAMDNSLLLDKRTCDLNGGCGCTKLLLLLLR